MVGEVILSQPLHSIIEAILVDVNGMSLEDSLEDQFHVPNIPYNFIIIMGFNLH